MCRQEKQLKSLDDFARLSDYVAYLREIRGYSLQEVVDMVTTAISDKVLKAHCSLTRQYLSGLEAGKYSEPSVFKLEALAYAYDIPYESLLQKAGYLKNFGDKGRLDIEFTLMVEEVQKLTHNEIQSVLEYIDFVKYKRKKHCGKCQE